MSYSLTSDGRTSRSPTYLVTLSKTIENGKPKETAAGSPVPISLVAVRLPPYWDRNPSVWFLQAESRFHLSRLKSQESKYQHVVSALSLAAADEVYDMLSYPLASASCDQQKAVLLQRTKEPDRSRLQKLISAEELGDRCQSKLLRRMTQLLGDFTNTIGNALLQELFIQRLPTNVRMVLTTATALNLTGLAALLDAVIEVATPSVTSVTSAAEDGGEAMPALPGTPSSDVNFEQRCQRSERSVTTDNHSQIVHALNNDVDVQHLVGEMLAVPIRQVQRTSAFAITALAPTSGTAFFPVPGANRAAHL